ncbi:MAG: Crp/Fnr family transcriptional regulator [Cocleimonas sp.]
MTISTEYENNNESKLSSALLSFLEKQNDVQKVTVPAGVSVCQSGDVCESLVILLSGQVKVFRPAESGRSLTLYYVNHHESCILTASCILNDTPFPAFAETITEVTALSIPPDRVKKWLETEPLWRDYVLSLLSQRMGDLIELVNALAFQGLDVRLADWLLQHSLEGNEIKVTHQVIAEDLASSREVISRLLKEFEVQGKVILGRGMIKVLEFDALKNY